VVIAVAALQSATALQGPPAADAASLQTRERAADARRSEYLVAGFESCRDGLIVLDDQRRCIDLNRAARELLHTPEVQLLGRKLEEFAPPGLRTRVIEGWASFLRDGFSSGVFATFADDGSRGVIEFTGQARVAAGFHMLVVRDIITSPAHQPARRTMSVLLDRSDDAVSVCSLDGFLLSWNRGAEKLFGYTAEEAIGKPVAMLLPPDQRSRPPVEWERAWRGEEVPTFEATRVTKDGRSVVVAVALSTIADESGRPTAVAAIARDVTEQKRAQATLAAAHAKAVETSQLKSQFVANMNHELRTPLNGVIGTSRLLEDTELDHQQREYVHALRSSGEGLMAVVEAILDFSAIEAGNLTVAEAPYDLRTLIEEVCSVVALAAGGSTVEVLAYVEPGVPAILQGDEQRVRQVLTNLTGNAVKFTREGDVFVNAAVLERAGLEPALRIEVIDSGIGIDPSVQEAIFESFVQADGSMSRRFGGSGLGLAIAKELVTAMGGEIGVDSAPGEGSTFWFTLPLGNSDLTPPAPAHMELGDLRVLVVDTKPSSRQILVRHLESAMMRVEEAESHADALQAMRRAIQDRDPFAIAIIDQHPLAVATLDAADLTHAMVTDPALRTTRTMILAAPADGPVMAAAVDTDTLVIKPVGGIRLRSELARVIGNGSGNQPADAGKQALPGSAGRVLVAEDNPVNQLVTIRLLELRGFQVDVANNGIEAVEMHAEQPYDAIFMDCQMPEMDGYEATREIRRGEDAIRHTPIIAMTASTLPGDSQRSIAAGMDYHMGKPIRPTGLDYIINQAICPPEESPLPQR
jgi:two-component system sensor histidine kinase/response regulator